MTKDQIRIVAGALLHDIGKVLYRSSDGRNHSESGYDFLKKEIRIDDTEILNQIRYHHGKNLGAASIQPDSLAYITYIADNIASAADRREKDQGERGFDRKVPLESIFNILRGNHQDFCYQPRMLGDESGINYPTEDKIEYRENFYTEISQKIKECLQEFAYDKNYLNSLLEILEAALSFVPSSTSLQERADISLYDHVKLTAAAASCIYLYLQEKGIKDYQTVLLKEAEQFYEEKVFMIYSMDLSGIQDFIYTITSKGALKGLRARSFYLEIMMEHMIDELLEKVSLSRVNLLYSGGGHCYLLLANTEEIKGQLAVFEKEVNQWFLETFQTDLFAGCGFAVCSAADLKNQPEGSYQKIFRTITRRISDQKMNRYTYKDLLYLNQKEQIPGERECKICHRTDLLREDNQCEICWSLEQMAVQIMENQFFIVSSEKKGISLPLPLGRYLTTEKKEEDVRQRMKEDLSYIRTYGKNKFYSGYSVATKLWVGDYHYKTGCSFQDLADCAQGIERIAVLRADVDNLGEAFVSGFANEENHNRYVTLSRTSTFSRKLSLFFKYYINNLLEQGSFYLKEKEDKRRAAVIVYSGGDDLFVVGSWDDIIGFAVDLYYSLKKYSQGTLTISGGIGIYPPKFPISVMAKQTGALEDAAKEVDGKNAITLFDERYSFHWSELIQEVIEEKVQLIQSYLDEFAAERGKAFLYRVLELVRARWMEEDGKINIARFAYQLSRIEPSENASGEQKELYHRFSKSMYQWIQEEKDSRQLELAIYLYIYQAREKEGEYNGED
nr:type III-A CRISPR-associated protein Cas10/Csm1 [uncultured Anaerostipes sp.]